MKEFSVSKCNIPKIPVFPKDDCQIRLGEKTTEIPDWECIDFATNPEIKNKLQVYGRDEAGRMIWALNGSPIPLSLYKKYKEFIPRYDNICILIGDISELSMEELEKLKANPSVKNIAIEGGEYSTNENNWYSLEEYTAVLKEVDKIIAQINLPDKDDKDREKKIFAQLYKVLGKRISYDHHAVGETGKLDEELKYSCRNMKNGLIGTERNGKTEYLSVCAGYADILRNVLACLGIKSDYISSRAEVKLEYRNGILAEKRDDDGKIIYMNGTTDPMGHAYNIVELDGQKFYCDLTWDASNIKVDRYPLANFLNSYEQFVKSHSAVGFNEKMADKEANFSLPLDAQMELFGEIAKDDISQMMEENYLSGFVSSYLESTRQDSNGHDAKKFLDMIKLINQVEQALLTRPEGRISNMGVNIGNETFVFETSDKAKLRDMKQDIHRKRRRESGHESR